VTIYQNGALNNFVISDVDAAGNTSPDYEFAYINDATNGIFQVTAATSCRATHSAPPKATRPSWQSTPRASLELEANRRVGSPTSRACRCCCRAGLFGFARRRRAA